MRSFGRYTLEEELGRGGMGAVFRGFDSVLEREVAIKVLSGRMDDEAKERLRREARIVARMDHPGIVPVFDLGEHDGDAYVVMALIRGKTLRASLSKKLPSLEDVIEIGRQIALALDYSHQRGVVHRDVKPENILLEEGDTLRAKVMDFGIATHVQGGETESLAGTPAYLAPEQARMERVDRRADVYALGAVLYECCTGEPPLVRDTLMSSLYSVVHDKPVRLQHRIPATPGWLDSLVMRSLEKSPQRRPQSARDVFEALGARSAIAAVTTGVSAIHGREDTIDVLRSRLERCPDGSELVLLGGTPGIGKTAVIRALSALAKEESTRMLVGRCQDRGAKAPFLGFRDALMGFMLELDDAADNPLASMMSELRILFPSIETEREIEFGATLESGILESPKHASSSEMLELLARALRAICGDAPMVFVLEDVHGDPATLEAIHYLHRRLANDPIMFVATYQPAKLSESSSAYQDLVAVNAAPKTLQVELGPLSPTALQAVIEGVLNQKASKPVGDTLYALSEGNPLHVQLLIKELKDSGTLLLEAGEWVLDTQAVMPSSLGQLLKERMARMAPSTRILTMAAAVVGNFFTMEELGVCFGVSEESAKGALKIGLLRNATRPGREGFEFSSDLVRQAVYDQSSAQEKQDLHGRFAKYLEELHDENTSHHANTLAHHFGMAGAHDVALGYAVMAAERALESGSAKEALAALDGAFAVLPVDGGRATSLRVQAGLVRAKAHRVFGDMDQAFAALVPLLDEAAALGEIHGALFLAEAAEIALLTSGRAYASELAERALSHSKATSEQFQERLGPLVNPPRGPHGGSLSPALAAPIRRMATERDGEALLAQGDYLAAQDAHAHAHEALEPGGALPPEVEGQLLLRAARSAMPLGKYEYAAELCDQAKSLLGKKEPLLVAEVLATKSLCCSDAGMFEEAHHAVREGFTVIAMAFDLERAPKERVLALLHRSAGNLLIGRGRSRGAIEAYAAGLEFCEIGTDLWERSVARFNLGQALTLAGDLDEGVFHLKMAIEEKIDLGDQWGLSYAHYAMASVAIERFDLETAEFHAKIGQKCARASGDLKPIAMHQILRGTLVRLRGDFGLARKLLGLALRGAERIGAGPEILSGRLELNTLAVDMNAEEDAWRHAEIAMEVAYDWGSDLDKARALLASAKSLSMRNELDEAARNLTKARELAEKNGNPYRLLEVEVASLGLVKKRGLDHSALLARLSAEASRLGVGEHPRLRDDTLETVGWQSSSDS